MKIGIAQINPIVGDFKGNAKRILTAYRACVDAGADLVVTPEMSLVGYPAGDLVLKRRFVEACLQALDYLIDEIGEVGLLVGYVDNHVYEKSEKVGKPYRNAASLLQNGELVGTVHKTLLPTYDVYDEHHYFEPSESCDPIRYNGHKLGVTICEDMWCDELIERPLYDRDPVQELKDKGAQVMINMSASIFQIGKPQFKANLLEVVACGTGLPLVYCNAVGATDQFIFDGHSLFLDGQGNEIASLPGFSQCVKVCDITLDGEGPPIIRGKSIQHLYEALVIGIHDYCRKLGYEKVCIGISGGVDSALTLALAVRALGPHNVVAYTMPSKYSPSESVTDALALAEHFKVHCEIVPIDEVLESSLSVLSGVAGGEDGDPTEQNIQSRIRGMFLMAASNQHGYLVLGTVNKTEMFVGNYAIYGDNCLGLSVLGDVPKKLVYQLSDWINRDRELIPHTILEKEPSPELYHDQRDSDSMPMFNDLDSILEYYVTYGLSAQEIYEDFGYEEKDVRWVQRRIDLNQWKRQQSAPVLRVTSPAFGRGRRMPIAQMFVD